MTELRTERQSCGAEMTELLGWNGKAAGMGRQSCGEGMTELWSRNDRTAGMGRQNCGEGMTELLGRNDRTAGMGRQNCGEEMTQTSRYRLREPICKMGRKLWQDKEGGWMIGWIRFWITAVLLAAGLASFAAAVIGNYRFGYILNRVHAGGIGDTQGLLCVVTALAVSANGIFDILKLFLLVFFMWNTSPVSTYFLSQIAYYTDRELWMHVDRLIRMDKEGIKSGPQNEA